MNFKLIVGIMGLLAIIGTSAQAALKIKPKPADTSEYDATLEKRYHERMGPGKISGKPIDGLSGAHKKYEKPVNKHGGCDSNMGGCVDR